MSKPFGLRNVKLVSMDGLTVVPLEASQTLGFSEKISGGELKGDDVIKALVSFSEQIEWELEAGGIPLEAYALITGRAITTTGTTPNRTSTLTGHGGDVYPYFRIYGQSLGDMQDDVHCKIFKCKASGKIEGKFGEGKFFATKIKGNGVPDDASSGKTFEFVTHETATPISV